MIALTQQERRILELIRPVAEGLGMDVVRLRIQGGRRPHLQIMAERAGGASTDVEDCARLSRALSPVLDSEDPIREAYTLEVSTPGIDRPLTRPGDFGRWAGHVARIELIRPVDGRRRFSGVILDEDEAGIHIALDDETELVAGLDEMSRASLVLTDELIEAARQAGTLPPQPEEEDALAGFEIDRSADEEDEETGDVQ